MADPLAPTSDAVQSAWRSDCLAPRDPFSARLTLTRPRRVLLLLAAVWVLNIFDLGFTIAAHAHGNFTELNPLGQALLGGPWYLLAAYKFVLVGVGSVILLMLARYSVAEWGCWLLLASYFYVATRWYLYFEWMLQDAATVLRAR